jgi:quercetin 2,3-dioxygenase
MLLEPRLVKLSTRTGAEVRRTLPNARKRMIGAWAFVDHIGPTQQDDGMVVAAHPHTGLQTVTWLFEGRYEHRDSIGSIQYIEPGQLNLMTAGRGIAHSELAMSDSKMLHSVQLWVALPDSARKMQPEFEHLSNLPTLQIGTAKITVFAGALADHIELRASAKTFTPLLGAELRLPPGSSLSLGLDPSFEHGFLVAAGEVAINGTDVPTTNIELVEVGVERAQVVNRGTDEAIIILLGGEPFTEPIVMWWNFIERSHEEIVEAREKWNAEDSSIPAFEDRIGGRTPAPELPNVTLRARV